jgi:hypothetical protein
MIIVCLSGLCLVISQREGVMVAKRLSRPAEELSQAPQQKVSSDKHCQWFLVAQSLSSDLLLNIAPVSLWRIGVTSPS